MICQRCGGLSTSHPRYEPGLECLCGVDAFELGGIFAAHQLALLKIRTGTQAEAEQACARVLERIDAARVYVERRAAEQRTALRGRAS